MPTKAPAESAQVQRKTAVIDDIKDRLRTAEASVLTEYRGLTVTDLANLRAALRPASTDYKVYKNTLARRAAADAGLTDLAGWLEGPVAIAFVRPDGDAVTAAKALRDFARTNPNLVVKGGMLGPRMLSVADVEALADVPPRDQLLARLAGGFQAPLVKAAGLFQAFTRNFAYGLKAYIETRAPEEEPPPTSSPASGLDGSDGDTSDQQPPAEAESGSELEPEHAPDQGPTAEIDTETTVQDEGDAN